MTPRSAKLHACKSHHAREFDDIDLPLNEEVLKTLMDEDTHAEQEGHIACCQRRVDGVEGVGSGGGGSESPLSSLLPHYMLRRGFFKSAATIDNMEWTTEAGRG